MAASSRRQAAKRPAPAWENSTCPTALQVDLQGQCLGRRPHQQPLSGARQQSEADPRDHQCGRRLDRLCFRRPAPVCILFQFEPERQHARDVGHHRRNLQGRTRRQSARQVRTPRENRPWLPGGPHDRLPQSERDHRWRDRIVARAETDSQVDPTGSGASSSNQEIHHEHHLEHPDCHTALADCWRPRRSPRTPRPRSNSIPSPTRFSCPPASISAKSAGVATNSKGDIFVYTRTGHPTVTIGTMRPFAHGGSRMFQFDRTGKYVREIGKDTYGFMAAAQVRVDPADNIWAVDEMSNMVMKFDPQGRVAMLLGRKAESESIPPRAASEETARDRPPISSTVRPTWPGTPRATSSSPMAPATRASPSSTRTASSSSPGASEAPDPASSPMSCSIAVDAQGNVYAGDGGNKRIQVFDNNGTFQDRVLRTSATRRRCA